MNDFDTLVISGGSVNGISALGALQYLRDNEYLHNIKTYIGTSSGAFICYLLAIGYTPVEIIVYICTKQVLEKMKHFNIVAMINGEGAASYGYVQEALEKMTVNKIGKFLTLKDLEIQFGKRLICVTYNTTMNCVEYLRPETHPDLPCITALRMSANLPLIFEEYKYMNSYYIDGGITNNFPVDIAENEGDKILGICFSYQDEESKERNKNIIEFVYKLMIVPIAQGVEHRISKASEKCKILKLSSGSSIKFFEFNISPSRKLELFSSGYEEARNFFLK